MGLHGALTKVLIGCALALLMLVGGPAATAFASAQMRFLNADSGGKSLGLAAVAGGSHRQVAPAEGFGDVSDYASVPSGEASLALTGGASASAKQKLADGARYTVVAVERGSKRVLEVYRDGSARGGKARLRVIHAAPE